MKKDIVEQALDDMVDLKGLSVEQVLDEVCLALHTLAASLEDQGVDSEIVSGAVFRVFAERMADMNDRETYDEILEEALAAEWDEVTIH